MSGNSKPAPSNAADAPAPQIGLPGAAGRIAALAALTVREAIRNRVLLGMTTLMCLFGIGSLMWPADVDGDRVILVQRFCYGALTFLGVISATFLAGSALPHDISSKRIYAIATKPVSRFELLTGKTCGLIAVMFTFMVFGTIITSLVTHVASSRKTYAGGSYTLEVSVPSTEVRREGGAPVAVKRGEILAATGEAKEDYEVVIANRDTSISGLVAKSDVKLRIRDLTLQRVAEPAAMSIAATGRAMFEHSELVLRCNTLAAGRTWTFEVKGAPPESDGEDMHIRMRFNTLLHESRHDKGIHQLPRVELLFRNPATSTQVTREVDFTHPGQELRPVPQRGQKRDYYEQVFLLPKTLLTEGSIEVTVVKHSPEYVTGGRVFYGGNQTPTWHIRGFDGNDLPAGQQTLRLNFAVIYTRGYDIVDRIDLTARITNPGTGEAEDFPLQLHNGTTSLLHFPRQLIDNDKGVDITLAGIGRSHRIGHQAKDSPLYLMLTPGRFWASTVRSAILVFLSLSLITVLAVAASTFLSAPVAILLTLVVALSGQVKDLILAGPGGMGELPPTALTASLRIPLLLIAVAPLVLAAWVFARRLTARIVLTACVIAAFAWFAWSTSVAGPTALVLAIPLTMLAWALAPQKTGRTALGGSVLLMSVGFLAASLAQFISRAAATSSPLRHEAGEWIKYVITKVAVAFAPGFEDFSSSRYIIRGWSVPWSAVFQGTAYALAYMAVCFGLGYALFQKREFE